MTQDVMWESCCISGPAVKQHRKRQSERLRLESFVWCSCWRYSKHKVSMSAEPAPTGV